MQQVADNLSKFENVTSACLMPYYAGNNAIKDGVAACANTDNRANNSP
jgi:hypothetical protein